MRSKNQNQRNSQIDEICENGANIEEGNYSGHPKPCLSTFRIYFCHLRIDLKLYFNFY